MRDNRSMSRVNDMQQQVIEHQNEVARKEALCARFLLGPEQIRTCLGDAAANDWGILLKPDQSTMSNLINNFVQSGLPIEMATQEAQRILSQAVDYEKWAAETDYTIESDSLRRADVSQNIDNFKELSNQIIPTLMGSMDPLDKAMGFDLQAQYMKALNSDPKVVIMLQERANMLRMMPPIPPQMPVQNGETNADV